MVRRQPVVTVQLAFDDCAPDWPVPDPPPRRPAGTRYHVGLYSDLRGQRLRHGRIVTIPTTGEYV